MIDLSPLVKALEKESMLVLIDLPDSDTPLVASKVFFMAPLTIWLIAPVKANHLFSGIKLKHGSALVYPMVGEKKQEGLGPPPTLAIVL